MLKTLLAAAGRPMKTNSISTSVDLGGHAASMFKTQAKLAEAQKEVTTGRLADVGASLGYKTGQTLSLRQDHARLKTIIDTNSVVSTRLSATPGGAEVDSQTTRSCSSAS